MSCMCKFIFRERKYERFTELAADYNVPMEVYFNRLDVGWSFDEAVDVSVAGVEPIIYEGIEYECYSELAEYLDLDSHLVISRVMAGWRLEDIINTPDTIHEGIVYKGIYYLNLDELVRKYTMKKKL